jgi:hypothetical protein
LSNGSGGMQRLKAESIGWMVAARLRPGPCGRVHSVFDNAFNIEMQDGMLVGVAKGKGRYCMSIGVPSWSRPFHIDSDDHCIYDGRSLWIDESGLEIDLGSAQVWYASPDGIDHASLDRVEFCIRQAADIAYRRGTLTGFGRLLREIAVVRKCNLQGLPLWLERGFGAVRELQEAVRLGDEGRAVGCARRIAGLGPGLTPSGDDVLAGFLGAWWWWEAVRERESEARMELLGKISRSVGDDTNIFGRQEIFHAAHGELHEAAIDLTRAIIQGEAIGEMRIDSVIGIGSSSGTDLATGICAALESAVVD